MVSPGTLYISALCILAAIAVFVMCKNEIDQNAMKLYRGIFLFPLHPPKPAVGMGGAMMPSEGGSEGSASGSASGGCALGDADPISAFHSRSNELGA